MEIIQLLYFILILFVKNCQILSTSKSVIDKFCKTNSFPRIWNFTTRKGIVYLSLCQTEKAVWLVDSHYGNKYIADSFKVLYAKNNTYESQGAYICKTNTLYSIKIHFFCDSTIQVEPRLTEYLNDGCDISINMMNPNCVPPCTANVAGHIIDLRSLSRNILVRSNNSIYNMRLCGENDKCGSGISICKVQNSTTVSLATSESLKAIYTGDLLYVNGHYVSDSREKTHVKVEIICNWNEEISNARYMESNGTRKMQIFQVESKYGCVKLPQICELDDKSDKYKYNLKKLYSQDGWRLGNSSVDIVLNVCGPLKSSTEKCQNAKSQICDLTNDVNRGSIFSQFVLNDDEDITLTISGGSICDKINRNKHSTKILFKCSMDEKGPQLQRFEHCETSIIWRTPNACPQIHNCTTEKQISDCMYTLDSRQIDFSPLRGDYKISDPNNKVEYFLNICDLVNNENNLCLKKSYAMVKKLNEPNIKRRTISIGRWKNTNLVAEKDYAIGTFSIGDFCLVDVSQTKIRFICSKDEDNPILVSHDECTYEFAWKTSLVCASNCLVSSDLNVEFNFDFVKSNIVHINNEDGSILKFNICNDVYSLCKKENCKNYPLTRRYITKSVNPNILMYLKRDCTDVTDFNKIRITLICDETVLQYKYEKENVIDCIYTLTLRSNEICKKNQEIKNTTANNVKCNITSNFTGYKMDISTLKPIGAPMMSSCPKIILNVTHKFVQLKYPTDINCKLHETKRSFAYIVIVNCSNMDQSYLKKSTTCEEITEISSSEACKLFKSVIRSSHAGLITAVVIAIALAIGIAFTLWYRRKPSPWHSYIKDGEL